MKKIFKQLLIPFFLLILPLCGITSIQAQSSTTIFPSYEKVPSRVYVNEIFPITIKSIITTNSFDTIAIRLNSDKNFMLLNPKSKWQKNKNSQVWITTLYLQIINKTNSLPGFTIELIKDDEILDSAKLSGVDIESVKLNPDSDFSGIIAKDLNVIEHYSNRFDENSIILTMNIEANTSNLDDIKVSSVNRSRVDALENTLIHQKVQYSVVIPNSQKNFNFSYFDTTKNSFESITIPIILKNSDISTQIDINPKENKFNLYKDIALCVLAVLFLVLFIVKRYKIAIVLVFIIIAYLAYNNNPFNTITIKESANIHILPNDKLTVLHITDNQTLVEKLDEKNGFIKILLPNGKIGWVKQEHVVKN